MSQIHVNRDGVEYGPFDEAQARALFVQGNIDREDLVWREGMPAWQKAADMFEVSIVPPVRPPLAPVPQPVGQMIEAMQPRSVPASPLSAVPTQEPLRFAASLQNAAVGGFVATPGAATPAAASEQRDSTADAQLEGLSPIWEKRFAIIEKAGGPTLPNARALSFKEKRLVTFNWWALIFSLFYYFSKGMWRKAIALSMLTLAVLAIVEVVLDSFGVDSRFLAYAGSVLFAVRANRDYYKHMVMKDRSWW